MGAGLGRMRAAALLAALPLVVIACSHPSGESSLKGFSSLDLVAGGEAIAPNGSKDALVVLRLDPGSPVTALTLRSVDGQTATWDTIPGNGFWVLGVAEEASAESLVNAPDGSVAIQPDGHTKLLLYFADNGAVRDGETHFSVTVARADGNGEEIAVARE